MWQRPAPAAIIASGVTLGDIAGVLARAEAISEKSNRMAAAVDSDAPISQVTGRAYETMLERSKGEG